jgi:hypothetical protein
MKRPARNRTEERLPRPRGCRRAGAVGVRPGRGRRRGLEAHGPVRPRQSSYGRRSRAQAALLVLNREPLMKHTGRQRGVNVASSLF